MGVPAAARPPAKPRDTGEGETVAARPAACTPCASAGDCSSSTEQLERAHDLSRAAVVDTSGKWSATEPASAERPSLCDPPFPPAPQRAARPLPPVWKASGSSPGATRCSLKLRYNAPEAEPAALAGSCAGPLKPSRCGVPRESSPSKQPGVFLGTARAVVCLDTATPRPCACCCAARALPKVLHLGWDPRGRAAAPATFPPFRIA